MQPCIVCTQCQHLSLFHGRKWHDWGQAQSCMDVLEIVLSYQALWLLCKAWLYWPPIHFVSIFQTQWYIAWSQLWFWGGKLCLQEKWCMVICRLVRRLLVHRQQTAHIRSSVCMSLSSLVLLLSLDLSNQSPFSSNDLPDTSWLLTSSEVNSALLLLTSVAMHLYCLCQNLFLSQALKAHLNFSSAIFSVLLSFLISGASNAGVPESYV